MPHRERAPQEVTPVRIEAARRARELAAVPHAGAPHAGSPRAGDVHHASAAAAPAPPTPEEIAHDALAVRRRALATAAYGVGAVAAASSAGFVAPHMPPGVALSTIGLSLFCGFAAVIGTAWTWLGARRLGEVGI